jgi:hypothetical protein
MEYIDDVIATNEDLLADLGVDSLRAVPSGEWKDTTLPRQSIAQRPVGTVVDGADVVQQSKEDDPCYGGGEQESEKPENGHQGTEALSGGLGRLSAWCWQWVTRLAGGIDGELRKAAGEGNEIIYRFLQVLLYMGVPILLVILVALRHSR